MRRFVIGFLAVFLLVLSPFIYLFIDSLSLCLKRQEGVVMVNNDNREEIFATVEGNFLKIYIPPSQPFSKKIYPPVFLDWGNGIYSEFVFHCGNWVIYKLPDEKCRICSLPVVVEGREVTASEHLRKLLRSRCGFNP